MSFKYLFNLNLILALFFIAPDIIAQKEMEAQEFAIDAAHSGMMKIWLSEIARDKSDNKDINYLTQTIINEHRQSNLELEYNSYWEDWSKPNELPEAAMKKIQKLKNTDKEFIDRQYLQMMVAEHDKSIQKFEKASKDFADENKSLSEWINETLEMLREHKYKSEQILSHF